MKNNNYPKEALGHDYLVSFPKNATLTTVTEYPSLNKLGRYVSYELSGGVVRLNSLQSKEMIISTFSETLNIPKNEIKVADTIPTK